MTEERSPDPRQAATGTLFGRIGQLSIRLAHDAEEIRQAQELRHTVFSAEFNLAVRGDLVAADIDKFDKYCDHLLVFDDSEAQVELVGTCRLLRQEKAALAGAFYSAGEFDIAPLLARHPTLRFLELGRSCVQPAYRRKRTIELMWHGIWQYVRLHRIDVLFGCASLHGTDPARHQRALAALSQHALAPGPWSVAPQFSRKVAVTGAVPAGELAAVLGRLPPLIKGYLRVGAMVSDGAVVDPDFGTTDICMILPVANINPRYLTYYGAEADRFSGKRQLAPVA